VSSIHSRLIRVELFDELLAEAKIITTGGTGEHGETQGNAETCVMLLFGAEMTSLSRGHGGLG
jgi:hypothetical protein